MKDLAVALKIKTEAEYQDLLAKIAHKAANGNAPANMDAPSRLIKPARKRAAKVDIAAEIAATRHAKDRAEPKNRQGVKETPIMASLRSCEIDVEASPTHVTILFKGARLFTLNEIYAILQYRSYIIFSYKKQWHGLVQNALRMMGRSKPHFDGPCKITLFRQGKKPVDRDSLMVMFKYIIDALKDDPKAAIPGIFPDDNPDIVFADEKIQSVGEPMVGVRVDLIVPAPAIPSKGAVNLFDRPPVSLLSPANQPAIKLAAEAARPKRAKKSVSPTAPTRPTAAAKKPALKRPAK